MNKLFISIALIVAVMLGGFGLIQYRKQQSSMLDLTGDSAPTTATGASNLEAMDTEKQLEQESPITLSIASPANGVTVTNATMAVKGRPVPKAEVFVNDKETTADANGNFSVALALDEGENTIVVIANDANGNAMERELTVTYTPTQ